MPQVGRKEACRDYNVVPSQKERMLYNLWIGENGPSLKARDQVNSVGVMGYIISMSEARKKI